MKRIKKNQTSVLYISHAHIYILVDFNFKIVFFFFCCSYVKWYISGIYEYDVPILHSLFYININKLHRANNELKLVYINS